MTSSRGGKKMWCVPKLDAEYIERMEDVLNTLARPATPAEPVVALDERPVQLLDSARKGRDVAPGKVARKDYEYVRKGVANTYCIVAPHEGRHLTHATPNRKAKHFAGALARIAKAYPDAKTIHLIMDNLNIHREQSVIAALGPVAGHQLWSRFTVHYTPKHASWLNPAEIECSLLSRECLGRERIGCFADLKVRVRYWNRSADRKRRIIKWRFKTSDARRVFKYKRRSTTSGSRH
jgi:transposase